ncbi:F0F1 ATP synthase subunit delta [Aurantivibrio infirmus]
MAELTTIARPYARAAFEFARDVNALDRWSNMLATAATVAMHEGVAKLLGSPGIPSLKKGEIFVDTCGDDLDGKVGNFIKHLAKNNRLTLLSEIREMFELLKANHEKTMDVEITSAFEISEEQCSKLAKALSTRLAREINLQTSVDSSLVGGAVIRAGDIMIDGSVRGRLAKLSESINI